jgi:hypothetical protein
MTFLIATSAIGVYFPGLGITIVNVFAVRDTFGKKAPSVFRAPRRPAGCGITRLARRQSFGEQKPTGLGDLRGHGPALVGWQPRITAPIKRRVRAATGFIRPLERATQRAVL